MDWGLYEHQDTDARDWKTADWAVKALGGMKKIPFMTVGFSLPHVPLFTTRSGWICTEDEVMLPAMKDDDRSDTLDIVGTFIGSCRTSSKIPYR